MKEKYTDICVNAFAMFTAQRTCRRGQGTVEYVAAVLIGLGLAYAAYRSLQGDILQGAVSAIKNKISQLSQ